MSDEKRYNGWTNYETWNVALWADNDQGSYNHWRAQAEEAYRDAVDEDDRKHSAAVNLADQLKDSMDENCPITEASVYCDLLGAALSEVNYYEIAQHWIDEASEEIDKEEAEEKAEAEEAEAE